MMMTRKKRRSRVENKRRRRMKKSLLEIKSPAEIAAFLPSTCAGETIAVQ